MAAQTDYRIISQELFNCPCVPDVIDAQAGLCLQLMLPEVSCHSEQFRDVCTGSVSFLQGFNEASKMAHLLRDETNDVWMKEVLTSGSLLLIEGPKLLFKQHNNSSNAAFRHLNLFLDPHLTH